MNNRIPSLAQSAVEKAWENEYYLVLEGRGTRDWTPEQQNQILTLGKAYDENGNPFEGHHMMSVEEYPELQGNPDNIQFLSREEHLAAHEGNFQNATNSYYDPETGMSYPIEDPEQLPYLERDLSDPVETEEDEDLDEEGIEEEEPEEEEPEEEQPEEEEPEEEEPEEEQPEEEQPEEEQPEENYDYGMGY